MTFIEIVIGIMVYGISAILLKVLSVSDIKNVLRGKG